MKEFLTKKFGGLPAWSWLLIGVAGIGAGYLLIRWQNSKTNAATAGLTANTTPDLTTGNTSGTETNSATGTVDSNGVIDNPFPETNVNGSQIPIIPPGYQAVYDQNGNIVGFEPIPTTPTPTPTPTPGSGLQGIIRAKTTSGGAATYDKSHNGVPIRSTPGGAITGTQTYGSTVSITGPAVQGPSDFGVTSWYPVLGGFISAFDFANIAQGSGNNPIGGGPLSPIVPLSASRRKAA